MARAMGSDPMTGIKYRLLKVYLLLSLTLVQQIECCCLEFVF